MIHLKANLEQAAKFSIRAENKAAAEGALRLIASGNITTRTQANNYIKQALEKARKDRKK
jgi:hypothetical protein